MNVYSFQDINASFYHPGVGSYSLNGSGMDSIVIDYANDRSSVDVAADGTVLTSKIIARNGTVTIEMQQTSAFNAFLINYFNYIDVATSSAWAAATIRVSSNTLGQTTICTGVSPLKPGQRPYKAQGQKVTWTFIAQNITER